MPTFDRSQYSLLKQAVEALAGVCDGAQMRDDRGFDGSDTRTGHLYAFLPLDAWPLSAFHRAWCWTKKYHRQLEHMGIDCRSLAEPPKFLGEDRQIALQTDQTGCFVIFPYDDELIAAFCAIPGNAVHKVPIGDKLFFRYRSVKATTSGLFALLSFAQQYRFQVGPLVRDLATKLGVSGQRSNDQHEYRVILMEGNQISFALYFPRIAHLNEEVKRIPGCRASYVDGFHWVIPSTIVATCQLRSFLERHSQFFVTHEVQECLYAISQP